MCGFIASLESFHPETSLKHRGPDHFSAWQNRAYFWRLAIIDPGPQADQPFHSSKGATLLCNGEIYNHKKLRGLFPGYPYQSNSDCEVILPLYESLGLKETCLKLDGEFAFALFHQGKLMAARDPVGIRPLFYGRKKGKLFFASEAKALVDLCDDVHPFPPGHFYDGEKFHRYLDISQSSLSQETDFKKITKEIRELFIEAVRKRLNSDAPLGFLLSGGLDSSLVCGVAAKIFKKPLRTFAVGIHPDPIDTKYAEQVASFIKSDHTSYLFTKEEMLQKLDLIIYQLETWDVTTIRASIGMYLLSEYIHEKTDIKVLLTGEVSDELFGYKYTDFAPDAVSFQKEAEKRIQEIFMYDVLRADRCLSAHSLEARVPFGDLDFVKSIMSINPEYKLNHWGIGKHLLRKAFEGTDTIPDEILYREKAAFSDAVGHSMVDELKKYADLILFDSELELAQQQFPDCPPQTKEALLYRQIFEKHYPGQSHWIKDFWMPNKAWKNCDVQDPSARVLPNYGDSGL